MDRRFNVLFLGQAIDFLDGLDLKARKKIYYNINKAAFGLDPKLFKKLTDEVWEFRTKYRGVQYQLFAFWDTTEAANTLVISTHGIIKKTAKISKAEMEKVKQLRSEYFIQRKINFNQ